jgi:hypothetical protein
LPSAAAAPETEVITSSPVSPRSTEMMPSATKNSTKNAMTEDTTSSDTGRPS